MRRIVLITLLLVLTFSVSADEGMWLPNVISQRIKEMKANGFKLTPEDLYSVNKASLKDAIVRFGAGCTGEIVSNEGLVLTNHHCGYSQIQAHSTIANDYLTNGFWARNSGEELPNPSLVVSILVKMENVTAQIMNGVTEGIDEAKRNEIITKNTDKIVEQAIKNNWYKASVESLYYGNQYFLFVYEVFEDVRLVGAPPSSIGKFGGDTDNWMYPRHTGDFSIFRIYADKDNRPAKYSKDNVPYKPKKFFKISTQGAKEGEFTFVYGFPGHTSSYVTSDAVDYIINKGNPHKINLRSIRLKIMNEEQDKNIETRIKYASKNAGVANAWKKWQGESKGLKRLGSVAIKELEENKFKLWAADKPEYSSVLDSLSSLHDRLAHFKFAYDYYLEAFFSAMELPVFSARVYKSVKDSTIATETIKNAGNEFYKNYSLIIDKRISKAMIEEYNKNIDDEFKPLNIDTLMSIDSLFSNSIFCSAERFDSLMLLPKNKVVAIILSDPIFKLYIAFSNMYSSKIVNSYKALNAQIELQYRTYMRGLMEMYPERVFYPDANSTLRIAYGKVDGYKAADAVYYTPYSTLEGIMEKDNPEIYDYNIPQKLRELYKNKDYGQWEVNGTVPVTFIATNHTTGGNSGSPVLNANGELLGLNFDRTWESTMSDIQYDPSVCRNISVDIRYVLFVIDKLANASYLLEELSL